LAIGNKIFIAVFSRWFLSTAFYFFLKKILIGTPLKSNEEAAQLKAFLETLNDSNFVKNPDLAEPDIKYIAPVF